MRQALICGIVLACAPMLRAQPPTVTLSLPRGSDPTAAKIYYLASGIGGYGTSLPTEKDRFEYKINAGEQIKQADKIAIVAYVPGCEISMFLIDLTKEHTAWRQVQCRPLPTITLRGQISPAVTALDPPQVVVVYQAPWISAFFGLADDILREWEVAAATPDRHGQFSIDIPNFCLQSDPGDASDALKLDVRPFCERANLRFILRNRRSHRQIAKLRPRGSGKNEFIPKPEYPDQVQFEFVPTPDDGLPWKSD